ncbi:28S ribosomal protein S25 [Porites harrisoni]
MADKSRLVYKAAKRFLDRQAIGENVGKFAVQRTIEHLKRCNVVLNEDLKRMRINLVEPVEKHNVGAHRFFWENFPQLKFKNPHVKFSRVGKKSQISDELMLQFGNGREEKILIIDKSPSQIMQEVIKIGTTSATRGESPITDEDT